eukprot:10705369-Heterocapsa_arctica.AAC.1
MSAWGMTAAPARGFEKLGDDGTKPMPTGAGGSYMASVQRSAMLFGCPRRAPHALATSATRAPGRRGTG